MKKRVRRPAGHTRRVKSNRAGETIARFVDRELEIVEGVKRGLDDMNAGRLTSHDKAMRRVRATIKAASRAKS